MQYVQYRTTQVFLFPYSCLFFGLWKIIRRTQYSYFKQIYVCQGSFKKRLKKVKQTSRQSLSTKSRNYLQGVFLIVFFYYLALIQSFFDILEIGRTFFTVYIGALLGHVFRTEKTSYFFPRILIICYKTIRNDWKIYDK